jgi:biopolymer transport protein ExbD
VTLFQLLAGDSDMRRARSTACPLDMTPMITVMLLVIILLIVAIKMEKDSSRGIDLADGKFGAGINHRDTSTLVIEVDKRGHISINNIRMDADKLRTIVKSRCNRIGSFPVLIHADIRARHQDVRTVMDVCTEAGMGRISFSAIRTTKT